MTTTLPAPVTDLCTRFLVLAPGGLVTGLYLTGGTGFGEWVDGKSDIDFIATLDHRPSSDEIAQLRAVHGEIKAFSRISFDGAHVLASDLAADPRELPALPFTMNGRFDVGPSGQVIAWHELARHGVTFSGPPHGDLGIWTDTDVLRQFTADNLDTYWRAKLVELAGASPESPPENLAYACEWCVLGVARLHHLIVTGEMTTKSAAGRWGLTHYEERWHRVIREALRLREDGDPEYADEAGRLSDTTDFTAYVVEAGTAKRVQR